MPSSKMNCPYCPAHSKSELLFGHLYSKHYSLLWSGKSLECITLRIKNKSIAPIIIILPDNRKLYACLGCKSATTSIITAGKHERTCSEAILKALTEWKVPETQEEIQALLLKIQKNEAKEIVNKIIDKANLKVNSMRKQIKELENQLKESDDESESEDDEEYNFRDEFAKFLNSLGL